MPRNKDNTASFVVRFTQNIYEDENGNSDVQWKGKISHVQSGSDQNFTEFQDAVNFMQTNLSELTESALDGKSEEEKEGILSKSLDIWKKFAAQSPKFVMDTLKDPKGQVSQIQEQIQEQINQVGGEISQRIEIDDFRMASKSDFKNLTDKVNAITHNIEAINEKLNLISDHLSK